MQDNTTNKQRATRAKKPATEATLADTTQQAVTAVAEAPAAGPATRLTGDDLYLFNEGTHYHLYDKLGAHLIEHNGVRGTYFAVWAPNAERVSVIGSFNGWN